MTTVNPNFYDLNASRGYPLDDRATKVSDSGLTLPDGLIVDLCLRFPASLGQYAFLSAINFSSGTVSCVINVSESLDQPGIPVVGLSVKGAAVESKPYQLTPLLAGVGGWIVFGVGDAYSGKFTLPSQSLLLAKTARGYAPKPVTSIAKENVTKLLADIVQLVPGRDMDVVIQPRLIDGQLRDAVVLRLASSGSLKKYTGPCGGRPESGTCDSPPIERLGDATPDVAGNITMAITGLDVVSIPNGLLLGTEVTLADICGAAKHANFGGDDVCESLSVISEINMNTVSYSVTDEKPIGGDGGIEPEPGIQVFTPTYPLPLRFFRNKFQTNINEETMALQPLFGGWDYSTTVPPVWISSDYGQRSADYRSLTVKDMSAGVAGLPAFSGAIALMGNGLGYGDTEEVKLTVAVQLGAASTAGLLLNWGNPVDPVFIQYQVPYTTFLTLRLNYTRKTMELCRSNGAVFDTPLGEMELPDLDPSHWYKLDLWVTNAPGRPGYVDFRAFIADLSVNDGVGQRYWFQVLSQPALYPSSGQFGFHASGAGAKFGYMVLDTF